MTLAQRSEHVRFHCANGVSYASMDAYLPHVNNENKARIKAILRSSAWVNCSAAESYWLYQLIMCACCNSLSLAHVHYFIIVYVAEVVT